MTIRRALLLDPDNLRLKYNISCGFAALREPDKALDLLAPIIDASPPEVLRYIEADTTLASLRAHARYVEAMGGAEAVKAKARAAIAEGDERWAVTLLDHLVFADPDDVEARDLLASAYDQLAYRAESGVWRSVYLSASNELRRGITAQALDARQAAAILGRVPLDLFFTAMATRLDGAKAATRDPFTLNFDFTDVGETHVLTVENGVLHHARRAADPDAAATVRLTRDFFLRLVTGQVGLKDVLLSGELDLEGSPTALVGLFGLLDGADGNFPIVTP